MQPVPREKLAEAVAQLQAKNKYPWVRTMTVAEFQYMPCPACKESLLLKFAYDQAECPKCGYEECYLD